MIPKECKRLAEVDFPIAAVSRHAVGEGPSRAGHPWALHKWWARRPLAACRSMLMALLLPDPCDPRCPHEFKVAARKVLLAFPGAPQRWQEQLKTDEGLRHVILHEFIADFANWDNSTNPAYLKAARGLVKAAYPEETPLVVDPFAGGGSIPLEALRLGCEAFASDLNPVACLILKVMLEDIPRHGPELADELRRVGAVIKAAAEQELAEFYPSDPDGAKPIAYLWARTVRCESPNCGAEIPLVRSFWLCKKDKRKRALRYNVVRPKGQPPYIKFELFEPTTEDDRTNGTVSRAKATCPCCNITLSPDRVRAQLTEQRGGADVIFDERGHRAGGATLLAVVTLSPGEVGRSYRLPTDRDYKAVWKASQRLQLLTSCPTSNGYSPIPDEALPPIGTLGFRVQRYGMLQWGDLFTARQKVALLTLSGRCGGIVAESTRHLTSIAIDKVVVQASASCRWKATGESLIDMFGRNAMPIVWDFAESIPVSDFAGGLGLAIEAVAAVISTTSLSTKEQIGQVALLDACSHSLPDASTSVWFTDPPYYDAIPYSDLADLFLVWLQRSLGQPAILKNPFEVNSPLSPKGPEIVQDQAKSLPDGSPKDKAFFESRIATAFGEARRILREDGIGTVVFAHKTTEGWEALLSGLVSAGWTITSSWPIATEMGSRLRARDSAALATSVHLVCRPRAANAVVGDWGDVLRELPNRVGDWMERLQAEGVRGADLVFACIGPALEIFSRYSKVETAEGREVTLAEYLEKVWEVVGRTALEQVLGTAEAVARNGAAGAVEEDARLTALFLWTLQSTNAETANNGDAADQELDDSEDEEEDTGSRKAAKGYTLIYDVVRRFAQPLGIHLEDWEARIIETKKGMVRLLSVGERSKQLFGEDGASAVADRIEVDARRARNPQLSLFPEQEAAPKVRGRGRGPTRRPSTETSDESLRTRREATTLDRIHAAMLLQASGRANALRMLLKAEQERGPDFLRLANALSALYPRDSEEKRLLDAMLLAVPR